MPDLTVKRHDLSPSRKVTLEELLPEATKKTPIDLTSASTVTLIMKCGKAAPVEINCSVLEPRTSGKAEWSWPTGSTAVAGMYDAEFEIMLINGKPVTVPTPGYCHIFIEPDLGVS